MAQWYVWGDFVHTIPEEIGNARRVSVGDARACAAAKQNGFDMQRRTAIGFEPWAAVFDGGEGPDQQFAFAASGTVRGWERA
jgi:hypothetical protein